MQHHAAPCCQVNHHQYCLGHLVGLPATLDGNPAAPLTNVAAAGAACGACKTGEKLKILWYSSTKYIKHHQTTRHALIPTVFF